MPGRSDLTEAVARNLFKLMAYQGRVRGRAPLDRRLVPAPARPPSSRAGTALEVHLAPPLLAERDPVTGHLQQAPLRPVDAARLSRCSPRLKRLRGTAFDPFGRTAERRMERRLLARVRDAARRADRSGSTPTITRLAVELASLPRADPRLRPRQGGQRRSAPRRREAELAGAVARARQAVLQAAE